METQTVLLQALSFLAARCDGAQEQDGQGFNKPDSFRGKFLAQQDFLMEQDALEALNMLRKYSGQLKEANITLPAPEQVIAEADSLEQKRGEIKLDTATDLLLIVFPYNPKHVAKVKTLPKARFVNGDKKWWTVPLAHGKEVLAAFPKFTIADDVRQAILDWKPPEGPQYDGKITLSGDSLIVAFEYNADLVAKVKAIPSARFDGGKRIWKVPFTQYKAVLEKLTNFEIAPDIRERIKATEQAAAQDNALTAELVASLDKPLPSGRTLFEHQKAGVRFLLEKRRAILADDMGLGKAQPLDAKVLTLTGWKCMSDLRIGEQVINSAGSTSHITGIFPQGEKQVYEVVFSDGSHTECCDDHLWAVNSPVRKRRGNPYLIMPLSEIRKQLHDGAGNAKYYIPMVAPVEFTKQALPIPPYLLGVILGDGGLTGSTPVLTSADDELLETIRSLLPEGVTLTHISRYDYRLSGQRPLPNPITTKLRELGLQGLGSSHKFIPDLYKYTLPTDRIELLRGILDTDGHVRPNDNNVEFITTSLRLAEDVREIVLSLGGTARIRIKKTTHTHNGQTKTGLAYRMSIIVPAGITPFRLSRKANVYKPRIKYQPTRAIIEVRSVGIKPTQCIRVDAPDHLYITDDYILTHNTMQALVAAQAYKMPVIVICPASLQINWQREAAMVGVQIAVYSWAKIPKAPAHDFVLIADEAHYAQSIKSARTKNMLALAKAEYCRGVILLTGTPIKNGRPVNLYPLLDAAQHKLAQDKSGYERRYCDAHATRWTQWDVSGASHLDELHANTRDVILRRMKKECLDLPEKTRVIRAVELSTAAQKAYNERFAELRKEYRERIKKGQISDTAEAIVMLNHVRHAGSQAKTETAIELAQETIEQGNQVVIFVAFREPGNAIAAELGVKLFSGETSKEERQAMVDCFQAGQDKAFVATLGAGGVGITLTAAQTVILVDRPWTPGDAEQAEDRLHRIGQTNAVTAIWLQCGDVDEAIDEILQQKKERIDLVLQGKRKTMRGTGSAGEIAQQLLPAIME